MFLGVWFSQDLFLRASNCPLFFCKESLAFSYMRSIEGKKKENPRCLKKSD